MEDYLNPKRMARSKKASSQRSKAKHSKHHHSSAAAIPAAVGGTQDKKALAAQQEEEEGPARLPSNWERYGEEGGSGSEGGGDAATTLAIADGEVRSKSKGADYSELLAFDVPKLFDEPPGQRGMMAMLLANGIGLWEWDSSYLEPASTALQWQAERDASGLLNVNVESLGKSMARLHVAERLLLEDTLFPEQDDVTDGVEGLEAPTTTIIDDDCRAGTSVIEAAGPTHEQDDAPLSLRTGSGSFSENTDARTGSGTGICAGDGGGAPLKREEARVVDKPMPTSGRRRRDEKIPFLDSLASPSSSRVESGIVEPSSAANQQKPRMGTISSGEVNSSKAFEANRAEAELDDLLDMLDSGATTISRKDAKDDLRRSHSPPAPYSTTPTHSSQTVLYSPDSWIKFESGDAKETSKSIVGTSLSKRPTTEEERVEESLPKAVAPTPNVPPSLDEDFDAWLDSI